MEEVKLELPDNFGVYWENRIKDALNYQEITIEDIKKLVNLTEDFDEEQVHEVLEGFVDYNLSIKDIQIYAKPEFDGRQMEQIKNGLDVAAYDEQELYGVKQNKVSKKDILAYAKPEFSAEQMKEILQGFLDYRDGKINKKDVYLYIDPRFDAFQMRQIRLAFEKAKAGEIEKDEANLIVNPEFSSEQMEQITRAFELAKVGKLTKKEVYNFAKPEIKPYLFELSDEELIRVVKQISKSKTAAPSM